MLLILAVILVSSSGAMGAGFVEPDQTPSLYQTTVQSCKTPGYQCSDDCTKIQLCVSTGTSFQLVQIEDCSPRYCDKEEHTCSDTQTTCRAKVNFTCSETGIFPDLYDCTLFHICADGGEVESGACDAGYAYDALTSACDLKVADYPRVCTDGPVPACTEEGQTGALESNPSIYYICTDNNTLLYRCSHGQYDPSLFACRDSTTPTSNTITPTPTPVSCDQPGEPVVDPDSCNGYYLCDLLLKPVHKECPAGSFFSPSLHLCLPGSCEDGAGTTTTPADATCQKVGMSSDPASCTGYYFCDASLHLVHRQCDTGTYFNKSLSLCVPGVCHD